MPENALLMEALGIFPTVETTLAQALFLLLVAATFAYSRWRAQRTTVQPGIPAGGKGA
ncbi:MAG: hypothetical protein M5T61_21260 [Acidimicrobiia bacterium]|nr:hypothetical protein [Acidimicrobiia bacterium]